MLNVLVLRVLTVLKVLVLRVLVLRVRSTLRTVSAFSTSTDSTFPHP